jgi:hypothetical protein
MSIHAGGMNSGRPSLAIRTTFRGMDLAVMAPA